MKKQMMLKNVVAQAKKGNLDGFENLYILTYQDAYDEALVVSKDESSARKLLEQVYIEIYKNIQHAPEDESIINWIRYIIHSFGEEQTETGAEPMAKKKISEEKAATILLQVEEKSGIYDKEEEYDDKSAYIFSSIKIAVSVIAATAAIFAVSFGLKQVKIYSQQLSKPLKTITAAKIKKEDISKAETVAESEAGKMELRIADQLLSISKDGRILSAKVGNEVQYNPAVQRTIGWTYYLLRSEGDAHDENLPEIDPDMRGKLFRISSDSPDTYVMIADDVDDYMIWNNMIYYMQSNTVHRADVDETFTEEMFSYHTAVRADSLYLLDNIGNTADGDIQIEDRIYEVSNGEIISVRQGQMIKDGYTYYLDDTDGDGGKELRWKRSTDNGVLINQGLGIDSFCIVENWIYYTATVDIDANGNILSKLYRSNLEGDDTQELHGSFKGNMTNMYYFEDSNEIYGEYLPDSSNSYYGRIAVISLEGQMSYIKDSEQREGSSTSGNDMLELVMVSGEDVYCLWHDYKGKPGEVFSVNWTKPLVLSTRARIYID